jgi:hypothetical protein
MPKDRHKTYSDRQSEAARAKKAEKKNTQEDNKQTASDKSTKK